jgi:tetratricopeptide (TPR) repeat protein
MNTTTKTFVDSLGSLLQRFCSDTFCRELTATLELMRTTEEKALERAKDVQAEELSLIDNSQLEHITVQCKKHLRVREYYELLLEIAALCIRTGEFIKAKELYTAICTMEEKGPRLIDLTAKAYAKRAEINIRQSDWKAALSDLRASKKGYSKPRNISGLAHVESYTGIFYASQGDFKNSYTHFKRALSLFEKAGDDAMVSTVLMNLGIVANIKGQFNEAMTYYQRALPQFEKTGDMSRLPEIHHNLGMTFLSKRDFKQAINQFDESLTYSTKLAYEPMIGISLLGKASAYARYGDQALSIAYTNNALRIFRKLNDHLSIADAYKVKGIIQRDMKNLDIAELYFNTSIRLNKEYNNPLNLGESFYELGLLYKAKNEKDKSLDALKKALGYFKAVGAEHDVTAVRTELSRLAT